MPKKRERGGGRLEMRIVRSMCIELSEANWLSLNSPTEI